MEGGHGGTEETWDLIQWPSSHMQSSMLLHRVPVGKQDKEKRGQCDLP